MRQNRSRYAEPVARRAVGWLVAWIGLAAVYATLIYAQSWGSMSGRLLVRVSLTTTLAPALMGVVVWWITGFRVWTNRRPVAFAAWHLGLAVVFSAIWSGWMVLVARLGPGPGMRGLPFLRSVLPWHLLAGLLLYGVVGASSFALRYLLRSRDLSLAAERAERLRVQAELHALRAHIDPHFLFNTLHSVGELLEGDPVIARQALEQVAELFRYALRLDRSGSDAVSLEEEWDVVARYLWLEQLRMGDRLQVTEDVDEDVLDCAIPPFTLQPVVENAVRHGLAPSPKGGHIKVSAYQRDGRLMIEVVDDGCGARPEVVANSPGLGLRSVRQRLAARYGDAGSVTIVPRDGGGTRAVISLPISGLA